MNSNLFIGKKILECQIDKSGVKIKFENIETPIILACEVELDNPYFDFSLSMELYIELSTIYNSTSCWFGNKKTNVVIFSSLYAL